MLFLKTKQLDPKNTDALISKGRGLLVPNLKEEIKSFKETIKVKKVKLFVPLVEEKKKISCFSE